MNNYEPLHACTKITHEQMTRAALYIGTAIRERDPVVRENWDATANCGPLSDMRPFGTDDTTYRHTTENVQTRCRRVPGERITIELRALPIAAMRDGDVFPARDESDPWESQRDDCALDDRHIPDANEYFIVATLVRDESIDGRGSDPKSLECHGIQFGIQMRTMSMFKRDADVFIRSVVENECFYAE